MEEPITDRHITDIVLQGLTEEYRDARSMTWNDPNFDLPNIQYVRRHLYVDGHPRNNTEMIAGRGTGMTAESGSPDSSSAICHNCSDAGHYKISCVMPAKVHGKSNKLAGQKNKSGIMGQCWAKVVICA